MKVALCISGQLRSFRECYPNIKKYIIDKYNPDVYVYASDDADIYIKDAKKVVLEEYKPGYWNSFFDSIVQPVNREVLSPYKNSLIMFYMIYKCQDLVDHSGIKYDYVIRLRPDLLLEGEIPGCVFYENSVLWYCSYAIDKSFQVSDKFLVGPPGLMKRFTDIWRNISSYWSVKYPLLDDNGLPVGERLVFQYLHTNNVPIASFDVRCHLKRDKKIREAVNVYSGYLNSFFKNKDLSSVSHRFYDILPFNIKMVIPPVWGSQLKQKPSVKNRGGLVCRDPCFIGVGFPKSGTTWWYNIITSHPDICDNRIHTKEVTFFPHYLYNDIDDECLNFYRNLFSTGDVCGEWSPGYIYHPFVLQQIKKYFPNMKLLVMMRNPVDAFISLVNHQQQVITRILNLKGKKRYVYNVFNIVPESVYTFLYGMHIDRLLKLFDRRQVLFLQFEDCKRYPIRNIECTFDFLDVDEKFIPGNICERVNKRPYVFPKPANAERKTIAGFYRDDVEFLKSLVSDFDYSLWRDFV